MLPRMRRRRVIHRGLAHAHANVVEGGKTPVQSAAELESQGFRIVIFPDGTTELMSVGKRYA
jgi:2-methylisocitrate lyase-like PEP mutase family enzyme